MNKLKPQELKKYLLELRSQLEFYFKSNDNTGLSTVSNIFKFRESLNKLEDLNLLATYIKPLKSSIIYSEEADYVTVPTPEANKISVYFFYLNQALDQLIQLIEVISPEPTPNSIVITLPGQSDLEELSKLTRDLHNAISKIVYHEDINGKEEIISVDNGSIILNVDIGMSALPVIGAVIWASSAIYNYIYKCRVAEENLRTTTIQNDMLEQVLDLQKEQIKNLIETEAKFIQSEHFKDNEAENLENLKNSIRIFTELVQKGIEVKPALNAPGEIKSLFPNIEPHLVESKTVKKLENQ